MFDRLEDLLIRFEEIMGELNEPTVANNQERFRMLMKEQSDLTPLVEAYREYKKCKQDVEDSLRRMNLCLRRRRLWRRPFPCRRNRRISPRLRRQRLCL